MSFQEILTQNKELFPSLFSSLKANLRLSLDPNFFKEFAIFIQWLLDGKPSPLAEFLKSFDFLDIDLAFDSFTDLEPKLQTLFKFANNSLISYLAKLPVIELLEQFSAFFPESYAEA